MPLLSLSPELAATLLVGACIILLLVTLVFVVATAHSDNSIMDIAYGPVFAVTALSLLILSGTPTPLSLLITALITAWAVRLSVRIYQKNKGKPEDARYAAWRQQWTKRGWWYFLVRSYLQISLLQGAVIFVVLMPAFIAIAAAQGEITALGYAGAALWVLGFVIESSADRQLDRFMAQPRNKGRLLTGGLFRYSRRPNYFGEALMWWALAVMVLPLPLGWWAFISPLVITYILTCVTGPMLEKLFEKQFGAAFVAYKKQTSYFIPLPPRR